MRNNKFTILFIVGFVLVISFKGVKTKIPLTTYEDIFGDDFQSKIVRVQSYFSQECLQQLKIYEESLKNFEEWALKMADATSKLQSGLLVGNFYNLGNFDECLSIEETVNFNAIGGKYCLGTIEFISPLPRIRALKNLQDYKKNHSNPETLMAEELDAFGQSLKWAACAPSACNAKEISDFFSSFISSITSSISFKFTEEKCQSKSTEPEFGLGAKLTVAFFAVIFGFVVLSTIYDIYLDKHDKKTKHEILIAFSALTNGRKLLQTTTNPNQLLCLNGIKAISIMWVIIGHGYEIPQSGPVVNLLDTYNWTRNKINMWIMGSSVSVDTFFLVGGLLTSYTFMGAMKKGIKFNVPMYYIHRYIRLTPALAATIPVHAFLLEHFGSGPVYPEIMNGNLIEFCKTKWWSTLLYVQNYVNSLGMCIPQAWYLAVDFQLFIFSPLFLIPMKKHPKAAILGLTFVTIASIAATFGISWHFELSRLLLDKTPEDADNNRYYYYVPTHTRLPPYTIGVILGYYIFVAKQSDKGRIQNRLLILILWLCSLGLLATCLFAPSNLLVGEYNKLEQSMGMSLIRPSWAIGLCWVIYACIFGYGGPIDTFLSVPIFQLLGKLTYSLYLVHYAIVMMKYASVREPVRYGNLEQMYNFWGDFFFSLVAAVFWTLMFESPMIVIEKIIFGTGKKTKKDDNGENGKQTA